jgi:molecular chaperone GrpE
MNEKNNTEDNSLTEDIQSTENHGIVKLQEEIDTLKDRLLRNAAEIENMRKRAEKQTEEAREYAISNFAKDLIGVTDNLQRALDHKPENMSDEVKNITKGIEMIFDEFQKILAKHHVHPVHTNIGDAFDYSMHQAISQVPDNRYPQGSIVNIMQIGYKIKDRLLRPAIVAISCAAEEKTPKDD